MEEYSVFKRKEGFYIGYYVHELKDIMLRKEPNLRKIVSYNFIYIKDLN